jgi:hypothetical protein
MTLALSTQSIAIPVRSGKTQVTLQTLDQPTKPETASGNRRPLILGISGLTVSLDDSASK